MFKGNLIKMRVENDNPIRYYLNLEPSEICLNDYLGKVISLSFNGQINCISCGELTNKSFSGGFCYSCFLNSPMNSECIIRPELCEAHLGKGRDMKWEKENHLQEHSVYLALSSGVKVGVTRNKQIPTRWIDQGASKAIRFAEVPNRYLAGTIEVFLKQRLSDKTAWQKMLKNEIASDVDLLDFKKKTLDLIPSEMRKYSTDDDKIWDFDYPVIRYPEKVKSVTFDKVPVFEGELRGIKGQYLILDGDRVLNIRRHSGYFIQFRE